MFVPIAMRRGSSFKDNDCPTWRKTDTENGSSVGWCLHQEISTEVGKSVLAGRRPRSSCQDREEKVVCTGTESTVFIQFRGQNKNPK